MLRKLLGITPGVAAFLLLSFAGGGELRAQGEGNTILSGPETPVTRVGNRGGAFLQIGVGARANGLGGAATTIAEGADALYWNPAGTAFLEGFDMGFSYAQLYEDSDINHYFFGTLIPFAGGMLGISVNTLSSGDIPRAQEATPSTDNVALGSTFEWASTAAGLTYARMITDRLGFGATGKWVNEGIDGAEANWFALDLGVRFNTGLYGTTLSARAANISGSARMSGSLIEERRTAASETFPETERTLDFDLTTTDLLLPTTFAFGLMIDFTGTPEAWLSTNPKHRLSGVLDVGDATNTNIQSAVGLEYNYDEIVYLRTGKRWMNEAESNRDFSDGMAFGFGLRLGLLGKAMAFDYAYTMLVEGLGRQQVFTIEWGL
jgi:hypothetical protein